MQYKFLKTKPINVKDKQCLFRHNSEKIYFITRFSYNKKAFVARINIFFLYHITKNIIIDKKHNQFKNYTFLQINRFRE